MQINDQIVVNKRRLSRETLAGNVERVTFHNPQTGFAVLRVKARGKRELVPVVGHAASISAGGYIHAVGVWLTDRTHGLQFKADILKTTRPTTIEGIARYLGSGMVRELARNSRSGLSASSDSGPLSSLKRTRPACERCLALAHGAPRKSPWDGRSKRQFATSWFSCTDTGSAPHARSGF